MQLRVLDVGDAPSVLARLSSLDLPGQAVSPDLIQNLGHGSADLVYLVSAVYLANEEWSLLRVRLAQANRYYIIVGDSLPTVDVVDAIKDGAFDVLLLADSDERWGSAIRKASESQAIWLKLYGGIELTDRQILLGRSTALKSLRQSIERLAPTVASVLILGESGVGKEKVAAALHAASGRGSFVAVNCAAIPKELMEAELFGAEKGAYTGAVKTREGLVEQASGGTLFLDEIGELETRLQPKLLRFLETRRARRVGGNTEIASEVRVISATNSNLEAGVAEGKFRSDLYYRLSEVILHVPPLRTRPEDIPELCLAFLQAAGERLGKYFETIEPELIRKFQQCAWPGNVRELRNVIDRLAILYDGPTLRAGWWEPPPPPPAPLPKTSRAPASGNGAVPAAGGLPLSRKQRLDLARHLMESSGNDLTWVAAQLGVHPTTLYRWRKTGRL